MGDIKHLIDRRGIQCRSHVNSVAHIKADFCCQHGLKMILKWKTWRKIFTVIKAKGFSFYVPVTVDVETLKHFMHLHYFHLNVGLLYRAEQ